MTDATLFDDPTTVACGVCGATTPADLTVDIWLPASRLLLAACPECDDAAIAIKNDERATLPLRLRCPEIWAEKAAERRKDERDD